MIGQTISHYKILAKLGEGGMGVVYKARDIQLDRDVALKFLPAHVSTTKENAARFLQEARAAAALNHANICTIYGVEEVEAPGDGKQMFISMEYIEGGTLREKLPLGGVAEMVAIAAQIGEALQEAHVKDIVHRDIKADNIMLNPKGQVKVMDFGLAKLKGSLKLTKTSSTVGTLGYMSPEQIGGGEVDSRSDIFSFGVLIFEVLTGRLPFRGEHEAAMVYSIMNEAPESITKFMPDASPELKLLISKALEKDPADRYQAASEMLVDLRRLKKSTTRVSRAYPVPPAMGATDPATSGTMTAQGTDTYSGIRPASNSGEQTVPAGGNKSTLYFFGAVLVAIVAVVAFFILRTEERAIPSAANMKMSRITADGDAGYATISPDGKYIVYVKGHPGKVGLWIRQVATSTEVPVIAPADIRVEGSSFSNDGNYVYYTASLPGAPVSTVYRTPVIGGVRPRKIIENVDGPVTLSPDDSRIAFFRSFQGTGEEALYIANADGSDERKLFSKDGKNQFFINTGSAPAWSPDGSVIACPAGTTVGKFTMDLVVIPVDEPQEIIVTAANWGSLGRIAWYPDGRGLIVCAYGEDGESQLFHVTYPDGAVSKITNDLFTYGPSSLSITNDATMIVSSQSQANSNIILVPGGSALSARELTRGATRHDGMGGLTWIGNTKVVYTSERGIGVNLWVARTDDGEKVQLTFDTVSATAPTWTADGGDIYYVSRGILPHIWRMDPDGGEPTKITDAEDYSPDVSPDGKWLLFDSWRSGTRSIWKQPTGGTDSATMFRNGANQGIFSPDGNKMACWAHDSEYERLRLTILSFPSGETISITDFPNTAGDAFFRWAPDGQVIHFIDSRSGVSNIWSIDYRTGAVRQLTDFSSGEIFRFAWSPDGTNLALARGRSTTDIVLLNISN